MNKFSLLKFVRPFHRFSLLCDKQKGPIALKNVINNEPFNISSVTVQEISGEAQKSITANYNVKKALKFIGSAGISNKTDSTTDSQVSQKKPDWQIQKDALKKKFQGAQWNPPKKLSRQEMGSVRLLKEQFPTMTASDLASHFKISPEAVRRILKSKWAPKEDDLARIEARWSRRGKRIKEMYQSKNQNTESGVSNDVNAQPVIILKYNPNGTTHNYYTKSKNKKKVSQRDKKYVKPKSKFYLLHKHKD